MGVYIKGMEMPKDYSVIVKIFPDGRVGTIPYVQRFKVELIEGTKAVPVPPHGRLIDADACLALINDSTILSDFLKCIINPLIRGEPTVIAAEGGET